MTTREDEMVELTAARRLAEEFVADFTPGEPQSFVDILEEAFQWLQDRSIPLSSEREILRERVERLEIQLGQAADGFKYYARVLARLRANNDSEAALNDERDCRAALTGVTGG